MTLIGSTITSEQVGQSNSPSENYLFVNVMVNFVIVNQKLTGSALHIEKNQTIRLLKMNLYNCNAIHSSMNNIVSRDVT